MKIILILFLLFIYTAISHAAEKQTDAIKMTENTTVENLTTRKTESKDKADKSKLENDNEKTTTEVPRKKNVLLRFFSAVKRIFEKSGIRNANEHTKDNKSAKDISNEQNYDYFVDKDDDGICDGRDINRPRRQRMGHRRGQKKN